MPCILPLQPVRAICDRAIQVDLDSLSPCRCSLTLGACCSAIPRGEAATLARMASGSRAWKVACRLSTRSRRSLTSRAWTDAAKKRSQSWRRTTSPLTISPTRILPCLHRPTPPGGANSSTPAALARCALFLRVSLISTNGQSWSSPARDLPGTQATVPSGRSPRCQRA